MRERSLAPVDLRSLERRSLQGLEVLIAEQRNVLERRPKDATARRNLGRISIEAANRVLRAQSLGRVRDASAYIHLIRTSLADTLWRIKRLAREIPAPALAALGLYYSEGILVHADPLRGCGYFARAAAAGQAAAEYRASRCSRTTHSRQARRWLEQAAAGGDAAAQEELGRGCIEGASVDAKCARKWLELAAAQGRVSAISVLAWLNVREGTAKALRRASELYREAAKAGDVAAQNNLGELFETGRGVARNPEQALKWYRRSAESGFGAAQYNLARMLAFGIGVRRDPEAARVWAKKALAQGIAQAKELLKLIAQASRRP